MHGVILHEFETDRLDLYLLNNDRQMLSVHGDGIVCGPLLCLFDFRLSDVTHTARSAIPSNVRNVLV